MNIYFIRHGKTKGNEEGRYIGTTDESLSEKGRKELQVRTYPKAAYIYVSPMKRCIETAEVIYSGQDKIICEDLREADFGIFEGKNYEELKESIRYQTWLDSKGTLPFPDGESREQFTKRCIKQFQIIIENHIQQGKQGDIAFIVHGGTIMAIMEQFASPKKSYYEWQIKNGEMLETELIGEGIIKDKVGEKGTEKDRTFLLQLQEIEGQKVEDDNVRIQSNLHQTFKQNQICTKNKNQIKSVPESRNESSPYFPLFFNLTEKKIVVAGAGTIAARRVKSLLGFGAIIYVIAPEISEEIRELSEETKNNILILERNYETSDCTNAFWVIAVTNSREINHRIGIDAKQNGAFVTVSDAKEESTVYFPGIAKEDNVVIGITASGKNHSMAKNITEKCREYLDRWIRNFIKKR